MLRNLGRKKSDKIEDNYLASVFEATFLYENGFTQFHTPSTLRKAGPSSPIYLFAPQLLSFVPVRIGYNH